MAAQPLWRNDGGTFVDIAPQAGIAREIQALRRIIAIALRLYAASGLQGVLRRFHLLGHGALARLESTLPDIEQLRAPRATALAAPRGRVGIFVGCIGDIAERAVAEDLARLLGDCGYASDFVAAQTCCGAIDQHAGSDRNQRQAH